jgi:hypothetical protein
MRLLLTVLFCLVAAMGVATAQTTGGGGAASSAPSAARGAAATTPGVSAPNSTWPGQPAPGVANTPVDPGRNNVDVNPPTKRLEGANPSAQRAPTASPMSPSTQPGGQTSQPTGKATQSANSDGYAECMAMWSPAGVVEDLRSDALRTEIDFASS